MLGVRILAARGAVAWSRQQWLDLPGPVGILPQWTGEPALPLIRRYATASLHQGHTHHGVCGAGTLAAGQSPDEVLRLYPTLHREDVTAVMVYAAELAREQVMLTSAA
jgi:hypothetical protein